MTASRRELLRLAGAAALLGTGSACARIPLSLIHISEPTRPY